MKSSNPVLNRLASRADRHAGLRREPVAYGAPGYGGYASDYDEAPSPYAAPTHDRMTVDDVAVRTGLLLAIVGIVGGLTYKFANIDSGTAYVLLLGGGITALIAGLIISFAQVTNPFIITGFAAVEGVFVGAISKIYGDAFGGGIVLQAAVATFAVFFGMAWIYKARIIRATPTFAKWIIGLSFGALALILLNMGLALFGVNGGEGLGIRSGGPVAIIASIAFIGIASLSFILDFAAVEEGTRAGLPRRYAWYCSFGILVGLVWLYLEILRLLSYFRD